MIERSDFMKNKIALLVYPEFSFQEIGNTIALFKSVSYTHLDVYKRQLLHH